MSCLLNFFTWVARDFGSRPSAAGARLRVRYVRVECVLCFCFDLELPQILAVLKTLGVTNILAFGGVTICLLQSRCTLAAGNSKLL